MPLAEHKEPSTHGAAAQFAETQWSLVAAAGRNSSSRAAAALEQLCRSYWYPLYAYVRRKGYSPHDAQDLTQEFFARLLKKDFFTTADPRRGRFRTYMLATLNNFLADEWDKAHAEKRGGHHQFLSLDDTQNAERFYLDEASADLSPQKTYDRRWALTILERALTRLKEESKAKHSRQFELLKPFLTGDGDPGTYEAVAQQLGGTANSVAVSVHRLRQRYRQLVRLEVAETVASLADLEEELRSLFA